MTITKGFFRNWVAAKCFRYGSTRNAYKVRVNFSCLANSTCKKDCFGSFKGMKDSPDKVTLFELINESSIKSQKKFYWKKLSSFIISIAKEQHSLLFRVLRKSLKDFLWELHRKTRFHIKLRPHTSDCWSKSDTFLIPGSESPNLLSLPHSFPPFPHL